MVHNEGVHVSLPMQAVAKLAVSKEGQGLLTGTGLFGIKEESDISKKAMLVMTACHLNAPHNTNNTEWPLMLIQWFLCCTTTYSGEKGWTIANHKVLLITLLVVTRSRQLPNTA